jgi:N6-L-threonylcarbamoyladenine synthase
MPCFLSGVAVAENLSAALGVPLYGFSHQCGHVMAAVFSSGHSELLDAPFAAYHVSGGTTELVSVSYRDDGFATELVGGTADLNAGQIIDRIGVRMGLPFPSGRYIEELALANKSRVPRRKPSVKGMQANLSGLENLALTLYQNTQNKALVAAYTLDFIGQTLIRLSAEVRARYPDIPMVYAGGVMSNRRIQTMLGKRFDNTYFSEPAFSADNAAGIALLCRRALHNNQ